MRISGGEARGEGGNLVHAKDAKPPRGSLLGDLGLTFFVVFVASCESIFPHEATKDTEKKILPGTGRWREATEG